MTAWAEKTEGRLAALEKGLEYLGARPYTPEAQRADAELGRSLDRVSISWRAVQLGTIAAGRRVVAEARMTLDASYNAGGETIALPAVPGRFDVRAQPFPSGATTWVFKWDEVNDKMLVYVAGTGAEVAAATDLSAVANWPIEVVGVASPSIFCHRASGPERVVGARLEVATLVEKHATNYWRASLRRHTEPTGAGTTFGTVFSTANFALRPHAETTLYPVDRRDAGEDLDEDDRVSLYLEQAGTPAALEDAVLWLQIERRVR